MRQKKRAESSTQGFSLRKLSISLRSDLNLPSLSSLSAAFFSRGFFAAATYTAATGAKSPRMLTISLSTGLILS